MKSIVVLKGGDSPEREVSLVSGSEIAKELRLLGYEVNELDPLGFPDPALLLEKIRMLDTDLVFMGLHGGSGENGQLQALLSLAGIPFTGSGFFSCALTMDKYVSKLVAIHESIPVPDYVLLREDLLQDYNDEKDFSAISENLGLPLVVKPNDAGSSVGISIVQELSQLKSAVLEALKYSKYALIEEFIPGRELTVTVLDGKALPVVEIKPQSGFYDYQNKYSKGNTVYVSPAELTEAESMLVQVFAERIWKACNCKAYARIDFRYDGEQFHFLEVNTLPGMTPLSLSPMAAKAAGISFGELLEAIISSSIKPD